MHVRRTTLTKKTGTQSFGCEKITIPNWKNICVSIHSCQLVVILHSAEKFHAQSKHLHKLHYTKLLKINCLKSIISKDKLQAQTTKEESRVRWINHFLSS